jgi:D-aspartate ligase
MQLQEHKTGVVVLGSDYKALGVARSLGKRGIPVVVIDNQPRSAWFSRYVVKRLRWHGNMDNGAFLHFLLRAAKTLHLEQWTLFPLPDETVELVARNQELLGQVYTLATQDWEIVQWANNKRLTYRLAEKLGVACPQTWYPHSEDELHSLEVTFPVILKPITSAHLQHTLRVKALEAHNETELFNQYRLATSILGEGEIMLQEVVPGSGRTQFSVAAYCKNGQITHSMTARRTRQYPIDYGMGSSFVEAIEIPELLEPARRLLAAMSVSGMVEVEFKYDARVDQYKLLDVNLRPWGWHTLCMASGLDFPAIAYDALQGHETGPIEPRYGSSWVRLLVDLPAGIQEIRAGISTPGAYLRSLMGKTVFSVLDWRDPLPFVGDLVSATYRFTLDHLLHKHHATMYNDALHHLPDPSLVSVSDSSTEQHITKNVLVEATVSSKAEETNGISTNSGVVSTLTTPTSIPVRSKHVGAIILGGDYQGLGIARSLGRHGIPVCIIDDEISISRFSRYSTHAIKVPNLRDEECTIETILEVGRKLKLDGWVLYPTRDETVAAIARNRERLSEQFRVPTPELPVVQWAWDKRNTYRLASDLGIPAPRTWYPLNEDELTEIDAEFPLVIKPAIKEHFVYATKVKAWSVANRVELSERFRQANALVESGEVMIQEMIPGNGAQQFSYCAFFKDGQAFGSMVAQRHRQHPHDFGRASTFTETVDIPLLEEYSLRFLKAIDYYGLVEMEYKLDPRNGQYKLLDVNARTWGYHTLGQQAGVDFPYLLFADQIGEEVGTYRAKPGIRWIRLATDVPTGIIEILSGRQHWRSYLHTLYNNHIEAVMSREDPLPGLMELALLPYLFVKRGF